MRSLRNHLWLLLALLAIGFVWWLELGKSDVRVVTKRNGYEVLSGVVLVEHRDNDGDSFLVRHPGGTHTFRLYFADAPEKRMHQYNGERLRHQARYFGDLSTAQAIQVGQRARDFTLGILKSRSFQIHTRWHEVFDSSRFYAFVIFDDGEDLAEKLVSAGLARIYTEGASFPDGRSEKAFRKHLQTAEATARREARGAWGL